MSSWRVNYKGGDQIIKKKLKIFEAFWLKIGPKYCKDRNMEFIEKYVP